jgi:predicted secreted protein
MEFAMVSTKSLRWLALLVCPVLALPAAAADKNLLFKCADAAGAISIQSSACAKGSTEVWRRDATAEPAPTPEQQAQAEAKRRQDQQTVRELSEQVERRLAPKPEPTPPAAPEKKPDAASAPAPDRCTQAQDFAAQARDKQWLGLSEDQVRRIYAWVTEQCKPEPVAD